MAFTRSTCFGVRTMSSQMRFVGTCPLTRNSAVEYSQMILGMSICKTPLWTMIYNIRYFTLNINKIFLRKLFDSSTAGFNVQQHWLVPSKLERDIISEIAIRRVNSYSKCFPLLHCNDGITKVWCCVVL